MWSLDFDFARVVLKIVNVVAMNKQHSRVMSVQDLREVCLPHVPCQERVMDKSVHANSEMRHHRV